MTSREENGSNHLLLLDVLRIKPFRYLWIGQMCSQLAINMMLFILGLRIYELTKSNVAVSLLYVAYGVPAFLFGMIAGVMTDHLDKRKVLAFCNISRTAVVALLFFFPENIGLLYFVMFLSAIFSQFYMPAEAPLIPRLVPEKKLLTANSLFSFTFFTSMGLGFILAGPILKYFGHYGAFFVLTSLFITAVWSVSHIPVQPEDVIGLRRALLKGIPVLFNRLFIDLRSGISFAVKKAPIADALLLLTGTQIVLAILGALGPGFADQILHIDVTDASMVILGPAVIGIILGALWVGNYGVKFTNNRLINFGLVGAGGMLALIAGLVFSESASFFGIHLPRVSMIPISLGLFFFLGVFNSFLDVPSNSILQQEAVGNMRGRLYGILTAVGGGAGILPVIAGGLLADVVGIGNVLLILGAIVFAYGAFRLYSRQKV